MAATGTTAETRYDVFISYPSRDRAWARRLSEDLSKYGLESFSDLHVEIGDRWPEALTDGLSASGALVVLWSEAAVQSDNIREEIAGFNALSRPLIPIVLGDEDLIGRMPRALADRQAFVLGHERYAAGPSTPSDVWDAAVRAIAAAVDARPTIVQSDPEPDLRADEFSPGALRALAAAEDLIGPTPENASLLCAAVVVAGLRTTALGEMRPTTGAVMQFVLERQAGRRDAEATLAAAAAAAGLQPLPWENGLRRSVDELGPTGRRLAQQSRELAIGVGTARVRLHHVFARGLRPDLPRALTDELGVTLGELRAAWRASLAETWPEEPWAEWAKWLSPLDERPASEPTARVHGDRWTTDDRLDYALYAKAIAAFIRHREAQPPMVISIQAPWGQGKTSLMRMVQRELDPTHPDLGPPVASDPSVLSTPASALTFKVLRESLDGDVDVHDPKTEQVRSVWFNAWKYQNSEQIWAGLAHAILEQLPARLTPPNRERFWLRMQVKRIDPGAVRKDIFRLALEKVLPLLLIPLVALLAALVAGPVIAAAGEPAVGAGVGGGLTGLAVVGTILAWLQARRKALEKPLEGAYLRYVRQPDYEGKLGYLHLTEEDMRRALSLLAPKEQPVVIFIDDLDRCSPAKIGEVIEAVNLFLAGEYPNCAFVLGIDAEVVAASMEVVHANIIEQLGARRGELGWRFMDKFVQLPFVLPRLSTKQRDVYLDDLFSVQRAEADPGLEAEADELEAEARKDNPAIDELARRAGVVARGLVTSDPERARELGATIIEAGANQFSDGDEEVLRVLREQLPFLSDNPRTIKRAVNLYRFHRFVAFARQVSPLPLEVARPEQIARWIVVIVRWPQFVHWVQAEIEETGRDPLARIDALAEQATSADAFRTALEAERITAAWTDDRELLEFLRAKVEPTLKLQLAGPRGLW